MLRVPVLSEVALFTHAAMVMQRGVESSEKPGRHRWKVEQTQSWLNRYKRLKVRCKRYADFYLAFLRIPCSLICLKQLHRFC